MKKILALLLAAVMCFSLVACGGGEETPNTDDSSAQEQQAQNDNNEPEVTDPDVSEPESTGTEITEPENTEPQYETVEITLDNWQEYFEIRTHNAFAENGFGEFERVVTWYLLVSKDGIVFDESNCNVTFEYTYTIERKPYTIDFENKTITYGETIATETSEPIVKTMSGAGNYLGEEPFSRYGEAVGSANILDELQGDTNVVVSVEITRISGSFCVAK